MSNDSPPVILTGMYTSINGTQLPYNVYKIDDKLYTIAFEGKSASIEKIFPEWKGIFINVNKTDFENFRDNVVNKPLASWIVTKFSDVQIPGTWMTNKSGGKKRSRKSHKRSGKKRKSHKRGHKKSRRRH